MTDKPENTGVHRDDLPPELLGELQAAFPGMKIVCVGDQPEGTINPDTLKAMAELDAVYERSFTEGSCVDCGDKMEGWPPNTDAEWDAWELPKGWGVFTDLSDNPKAFQCPVCDAKESSEAPQ